MARVTYEHITKQFGASTIALKDFTLDITDGEFLVVLGPSGCGKTTTLRLLAGLETADHGDIRIDGRSVLHVEPKDRDVALVFQQYALYPHMTVRNNLLYPLTMRKMTASERTRRVDAAASLLNIAELLDRKPAQLSGGQQQRVALGRALVREPRVFLMDEPLSNLDVTLRTHMRAEIKRIHRTVGATTLFVTHDQAEALGMADRIAVLAGGELQQLATPDEVYNRPANRLVARFMGSPPMNLLDAYSTGEELITKCGWKLPLPIGARALPLRNVTVGIRPEMIRIATDSSPWASPAYISLTEPLGAEVIVHAQVGESIILVRTSPEQRVHAGERLYLTAEEVGMRLFDGSSGQRVY